MVDLHDRVERAIAEREAAARAATERPWLRWHDQEHIPGWDGFIVIGDNAAEGEECNPVARVYVESDAAHITLNDPDAVLRRCSADRRLLELHKPTADERDYPAEHTRWYCPSCCDDRCDALDEHKAPDDIHCCESLDALAEGYGITP